MQIEEFVYLCMQIEELPPVSSIFENPLSQLASLTGAAIN